MRVVIHTLFTITMAEPRPVKASLRVGIWPCRFCDIVYSRAQTLSGHETRDHGHQMPYPCPHCIRGYEMYHALAYHMRVTHSMEPPNESARLICECGESFGNRIRYNVHRRTCRLSRMPFRCSECGVGFLGLGSLERHKAREH